jgi:hypothetical protein
VSEGSPPGDVGGAHTPASAKPTTTHRLQPQCKALRRRRAASQRLPGGDPWRYEPPVAGYEDAAVHLLELGLTPGLCLPALRRMWRSGSESRRVAQTISERWEAA